MDILIKGMEMPKSCYSEVYSSYGYCPFHFFDYHGRSHCSISACKCLKTRRPKDCPLVPVPEHGDLIDRDDLVARFQHFTSHPTGYEVVSKIFDSAVVLEANT